MRILLLSHVPFGEKPWGATTAAVAQALAPAGHHVRSLVVDETASPPGDVAVRRVICRATPPADLALALPQFVAKAPGQQTFLDLDNRELADYRDVLRRGLDDEIDRFDPQLIHVERLWLFGHLALETGVPYLVATDGIELPLARADERYRRFVQETAENAGRIVVSGPSTRDSVLEACGELDDRVVVAPRRDESVIDEPWLVELYGQVLADRFG